MFIVEVYAGDICVEELSFLSEEAAVEYASEQQDEGFKVRLFQHV